MTTYTALDTAVWLGPQLVCRAATNEYAKAIAEAMNDWQGK